MSDPFVAEVRVVGFNFAPKGWAFCSGQLLPISQNTALFSLLGTTYGGDGRETFALPNFNGSVPIQQGSNSLGEFFLGDQAGEESVTLLVSEMPQHTHTASASSVAGRLAVPVSGGNLSPTGRGVAPVYTASTAGSTTMGGNAISVTGGSQPHNNMMPYVTLNYIIAMQGIFPTRP